MAFRDTPSSSLGEQSDPHPLDLPCPSRSCGAPSTAGSSVCPGVLIAHAPPPPHSCIHTHPCVALFPGQRLRGKAQA